MSSMELLDGRYRFQELTGNQVEMQLIKVSDIQQDLQRLKPEIGTTTKVDSYWIQLLIKSALS